MDTPMANAAEEQKILQAGRDSVMLIAKQICRERLEKFNACDWCREFYSWDQCHHSLFTDRGIDNWYDHLKSNKHRKAMGLTVERSGNGSPTGAFAFTLTKSPKDPLTVGDMLTAVRKVMSQKSCKVLKYAWYYEEKGRDENGDPIHPHIHGMYETETGGRIESKHFKRAWHVWNPAKPMGAGFQGGYHRPVRSDEGYSNYIKKDGGMSETFGLQTE